MFFALGLAEIGDREIEPALDLASPRRSLANNEPPAGQSSTGTEPLIFTPSSTTISPTASPCMRA
jgi:hypothetical protein